MKRQIKRQTKPQLPAELRLYTAAPESLGEDMTLPAHVWKLLDSLSAGAKTPAEIGACLSLAREATFQVIAKLLAAGLISEELGLSYAEWKNSFISSEHVEDEAVKLMAIEGEGACLLQPEIGVNGDDDFHVNEPLRATEERVSFEIA